MARTRLIKPSFFENDELSECSSDAQLLFIGLWTIADRDGRLEDRPKKIKGAIFRFRDVDVDAMLTELAARGFVDRYEVDGVKVVWIPAFGKHQRPHPKEPPSELPAKPCTVAAGNNPVVEKHGEDGSVCSRISFNPSILKSSNPTTPAKPAAIADSFREWYAVYPRKAARAAAEKAYPVAVRAIMGRPMTADDAFAFLLERCRAFAGSPKGRGDPQFIPHPATWLNKGCYDDDPQTWASHRSTASHSASTRGPTPTLSGVEINLKGVR